MLNCNVPICPKKDQGKLAKKKTESIIPIDSRIPDVFSLISRLVGSLNQSWDLMDNF